MVMFYAPVEIEKSIVLYIKKTFWGTKIVCILKRVFYNLRILIKTMV